MIKRTRDYRESHHRAPSFAVLFLQAGSGLPCTREGGARHPARWKTVTNCAFVRHVNVLTKSGAGAQKHAKEGVLGEAFHRASHHLCEEAWTLIYASLFNFYRLSLAKRSFPCPRDGSSQGLSFSCSTAETDTGREIAERGARTGRCARVRARHRGALGNTDVDLCIAETAAPDHPGNA